MPLGMLARTPDIDRMSAPDDWPGSFKCCCPFFVPVATELPVFLVSDVGAKVSRDLRDFTKLLQSLDRCRDADTD